MADQDHDNGKPAHPVSQLNMASKAHLPLPDAHLVRKEGFVSKAESKWNTKNLALRVAADFVAAAAAASLVAPLISIIDR